MRGPRRTLLAVLAGMTLPLLTAGVDSPAGHWAGVTDMAHGELALVFDLQESPDGWTGTSVLGSADLAGAGVAVDSLEVRGDAFGFAFELRSAMGLAHVRIDGTATGDRAEGTVSLSSSGVVVDRGTWSAERTAPDDVS